MKSEPAATELVELLRQAREYARYFGELGAETIDAALQTPTANASAKTIEPAHSKPAASLETRTSIAPTPTLFARAVPAPLSNARPENTLFAVADARGAAPQSTETLENIWADIGDCTRCGLCAGRTQVVNTHGNPTARLMFVGEAPGADEDAQGKPFVGRAGQLLTKMIEAMGMKREDVIIG